MLKIGKKKIIILIVIVVLILAAGGFFWWKNREIKGSFTDYVIKETAEGKIVENKKAGLVVKVPEGWSTKRVEMEGGAIDFYSPEMEANWKEEKLVLPIKKGCKIQASVSYEKANFTDIKINLRYSYTLMGMKSVRFEEVIINNYPTLKSFFGQEEGNDIGVSASIPMGNKVYGFSVVWGSNEKEDCVQEFDKFLETISID